MSAADGVSGFAGVIGMLFEQHGHRQLPAGLKVHMRKLNYPMAASGARGDSPSRHVRPRLDDSSMGASGDGGHGPDLEQLPDWDLEQLLDCDVEQLLVCDLEQLPDCDGLEELMEFISHHQPMAHMSGFQEGLLGGPSTIPQPHPATPNNTYAATVMQQLEGWGLGTLPSQDEVQLAAVKHKWDRPGLDILSMDNIYLQPTSANNPAYDAYYCHNGGAGGVHCRFLLQYTVSQHHGVRAQYVLDFLDRLNLEDRAHVKLVFVIPASPVERYLHFKPQPWLGVKGQVRHDRRGYGGNNGQEVMA